MGIKDEVTLKGVEKYKEAHVSYKTGDKIEVVVEPILFDEVEYRVSDEEIGWDTWKLKPHLSEWKVRSVKP